MCLKAEGLWRMACACCLNWSGDMLARAIGAPLLPLLEEEEEEGEFDEAVLLAAGTTRSCSISEGSIYSLHKAISPTFSYCNSRCCSNTFALSEGSCVAFARMI